jgi:hypothetical protein
MVKIIKGCLQNLSILILTTYTVVGQCPDSDKLKFGGDFGTSYGAYHAKTATIEYFYYDVDTSKYCCQISKIQKYSDFILQKAEKYIKQRAGNLFYNKLIFQNFMVIYHDYSVLPNFDSVKYDLDKSGKINYWLTYSYFPDSSIEYGFGIEFDSKGNRISEHKIPDFSKNKNFMDLISPCKALEIEKTQKIVEIDSVKSIELNYDDKINSFVWIIKEGYPDTEGNNESDILFINANSGRLYKTEKEMHLIEH